MRIMVILLFVNIFLFSEINIVTSKKNSLQKINSDTLSGIYLKKVTTVDNTHIIPIDTIEDYNEFYKKVVKKTPQQIHSYWMKEIFTGKKRPPKKVLAKDLEKTFQKNKNTIGYTSKSVDKKKIKVIHEVK